MRRLVSKIIDTYDKRMNAYAVLLDLRYYNICPKADALSLLSVNVDVDGEMLNIEEVAQAAELDWNQLLVVPHDPELLPDILKGIKKAHPDFKFSTYSPDNTDDEESIALLFTMQKVDDDRRDFLNQAVDALYDQCATILKAEYDKGRAELEARYLIGRYAKEEQDEANLLFDKTYSTYVDHIDESRQNKLNDIDYAYQQYLLDQQEDDTNVASSNATDSQDVTTSMRIDNE